VIVKLTQWRQEPFRILCVFHNDSR